MKSSLNEENRTKIEFEILEQLSSITVILVSFPKGHPRSIVGLS